LKIDEIYFHLFDSFRPFGRGRGRRGGRGGRGGRGRGYNREIKTADQLDEEMDAYMRDEVRIYFFLFHPHILRFLFVCPFYFCLFLSTKLQRIKIKIVIFLYYFHFYE